MIDTMDKHSCELFLEDALEIGRRLVETGAEVKRVEDTVRRICIAYGFTDCEPFGSYVLDRHSRFMTRVL